jgi:hypothetical protein
MISETQSSSPLLERLARNIRPPEVVELEKAEAALKQVTDFVHLVTQAALLAAGFHTHKRQWRKTRDGRTDNIDCSRR